MIRTLTQGCVKIKRAPHWGSFFIPVEDPEGKHDVDLASFALEKDFPKIPGKLWNRWINLTRHFCRDTKKADELEVSAVFVRGEQSNYREWRILIPRQKISAISVRADFEEFVDIETGERIKGFPEEWPHCGSTHSHNTMPAFFSGTDDHWELDVAGAHIVVGKLDDYPKYQAQGSIVCNNQRFLVPITELIDFDDEDADFHPNCLKFIEEEKPEPPKKPKKSEINFADLFSTKPIGKLTKNDKEVLEKINDLIMDRSPKFYDALFDLAFKKV